MQVSRYRYRWISLTLGAICCGLLAAFSFAAGPDFTSEVLPILSEHCYACHGPDEAAREADLRLDLKESAFEDRGGYAPFVAGDAEASEALARVLSDSPDDVMPPPEFKHELDDEKKRTLVEWIESGAEWSEHWAFTPPEPPNGDAGPGQIDRLVRERLAEAGLQPAPPANRATLLRRLYADLTGLPPTPVEIDAFVADDSPEAYEQVVDRLLASPEHAEWLTLEWCDVARYADSHGLHADGERTSWPWRDWVLKAFAENMPYDEFLTWQLAGDLLPKATRKQRLATAFLRNHPMTGEGGAIDEEFRLNYVFDRTETVGAVALGLTLNCCRCHDHKFDPVSQKDYYRFAAFFNNVRELGMTGDDGDYGPLLALPDEATEQRLAELDDAIDRIDNRLAGLQSSAARFTSAGVEPPEPDRHLPLDGAQQVTLPPEPAADGASEEAAEEGESEDEGEERKEPEPVWLVDGATFVTNRHPKEYVPGVADKAARIEGEYGYLELKETGLIDVADPISAALWVFPEPSETTRGKTRVLLGNGGNKNEMWRGWEFYLDTEGRLALSLTHSRPAERVLIRTKRTVPDNAWTHAAFAYHGSGAAAGAALYLNGRRQTVEVVDDNLHKTIRPPKVEAGYPVDHQRKLRVGRSYRSFTGDNGIYQGLVDDLKVYTRRLSDVELAAVYDRYERGRAATPALSPRQRARHQLTTSNVEWRDLVEERRGLLAERVRLATDTAHIMVVREEPTPRDTYVLARGQYDRPGERVEPDTPEVLGTMPDDARRDRLGLARWVFSDENPIAARVAVNRYWQMLMGQGLVATPHDFGLQGARPSNLRLLDHLAVEFRASGWDLRALLRRIVMSETYRQSSSLIAWRENTEGTNLADPLQVDPTNRLLWRATPRRLKAEAIRDAALAASGLLVKRVGGPSVKPYQPEGLWIEKSNFSQELMRYKRGAGDDLYRRSLYTFVRRTSPPPSMNTFDAPNRSTCIVKRELTNTPLQALVLLNDPQFVEAARVAAAAEWSEHRDDTEACIDGLYRRLLGERADVAERSALTTLYETALEGYEADPAAATALLAVGESPTANDTADHPQIAALSVVASTLMSHDAFYTRR